MIHPARPRGSPSRSRTFVFALIGAIALAACGKEAHRRLDSRPK